jgi:arginyl-tRNA synthetase
MITALSQAVEKTLIRQIEERYRVQYDHLNFGTPPKIEMGELALPIAFDLARRLKRPPREIAQELSADAQQIPGLWKVDVAGGGFLNFHVDRAAFALRLAESIDQKLFGRISEAEKPGKIIVEHTNINPNKAAHIGHLRNAVLGDSFVRCLRFLGHQVEVQNYLDNTGVQVADVVVGLERMEGKTLQEVSTMNGKFDYYCWDVYARVADFYQQSQENLRWRSLTLRAIEAGNNATA